MRSIAQVFNNLIYSDIFAFYSYREEDCCSGYEISYLLYSLNVEVTTSVLSLLATRFEKSANTMKPDDLKKRLKRVSGAFP